MSRRRVLLYVLAFICAGAVFGKALQARSGAYRLGAWTALVLSGAITGTLLWLLHSPLARLPGDRARRLVGALAGALIGAAASALVAALLRTPMAALAARLSAAAGFGAAMALGLAMLAIGMVGWAPGFWVWGGGRAEPPVQSRLEFYALAMSLPASYGWVVINLVGPGSRLVDPMLVGAAAGALAGLLGPGRAGGALPRTPIVE